MARTAKEKAAKEAQSNFAKGAQLECGHINKQFINTEGKREDLACTLLKGHEGDHYAKHKHVVTDYGVDDNSRPVVVGTHLEETEGYWSDAAGVYPKPVTASQQDDFKRRQAALQREHSKDGVEVDPGITAKVDTEVKGAYSGNG